MPTNRGRAWTFSISSEKVRDTVVLRPSGRFGHKAAPVFERAAAACLEQGPTAIVIDLTDVDYLSSPGLRAIVSLAAEMQRRKGQVVVRGAQDAVRVTLGLADFARQRGPSSR